MIKICAFADEAARSLEEQIEALKRNKVKYLELRAVNGTGVSSITVEDATEYSRILKENGIEVYSIGSPIGKVDVSVDFDKYLEDITHIFRLAKIFGTDKIRMFSFYNAYGERDRVIDYLRRMVAKAKEYGLELYHENEKGIYGDVAERVIDILDNVPGLKSVYDPANFLQVGEEADKTLDLLHSRTDYFHIKDVEVATGHLLPAGEGDGKIEELIRRIEGDTVLTVEPHLAVFDGYASLDKTEMKHKHIFESKGAAFDAAVGALRYLLLKAGYVENNFEFKKG